MEVFIDGDACPVINETIMIAKKFNLDVTIICDMAHVIKRNDAKTICVSTGSDSVDFKLVNLINSHDIVVTQDYGLAAMVLSKQAFVINQNGFEYTTSNIDDLLFTRYMSAKIRKSGGRLKGPKKRTMEQTKAFKHAFYQLCERLTATQ